MADYKPTLCPEYYSLYFGNLNEKFQNNSLLIFQTAFGGRIYIQIFSEFRKRAHIVDVIQVHFQKIKSKKFIL